MLFSSNATIKLCNRALEAVRPDIPTELYDDVHDYVNKHGEWGLGMETLIDGISDREITISGSQYRRIRKAMAAMGQGNSDRLRYMQEHNVVATLFSSGDDEDDGERAWHETPVARAVIIAAIACALAAWHAHMRGNAVISPKVGLICLCLCISAGLVALTQVIGGWRWNWLVSFFATLGAMLLVVWLLTQAVQAGLVP